MRIINNAAKELYVCTITISIALYIANIVSKELLLVIVPVLTIIGLSLLRNIDYRIVTTTFIVYIIYIEIFLYESIDYMLLNGIIYTTVLIYILISIKWEIPNTLVELSRIARLVIVITLFLASVIIAFLNLSSFTITPLFFFLIGPVVEGFTIYTVFSDRETPSFIAILCLLFLVSSITFIGVVYIAISLVNNSLKIFAGLEKGVIIDYITRFMILVVLVL